MLSGAEEQVETRSSTKRRGLEDEGDHFVFETQPVKTYFTAD